MKRLVIWSSFIVLVLLSTCNTGIEGEYHNSTAFSSTTVDLNSDGTYTWVSESKGFPGMSGFGIDEVEEGTTSEASGTWSLDTTNSWDGVPIDLEDRTSYRVWLDFKNSGKGYTWLITEGEENEWYPTLYADANESDYDSRWYKDWFEWF
jgi:hypothetical protein